MRWFEASGKSKSEVGRELGCSGVYVGYLLSGQRDRPGLDVAFAIERITATWDEGPIEAKEWAHDLTVGGEADDSDDAPALPATGTDGC